MRLFRNNSFSYFWSGVDLGRGNVLILPNFMFRCEYFEKKNVTILVIYSIRLYWNSVSACIA